jgi:hypothetical protein
MTLDQALSRLATVPPKLFARERSAVLDQLRRAGNAKAAQIVKARRVPTIPVWAANRLALEQRKTLDELIAAADRLKAIQLGRRKEPQGLTTAMAAYRALLDRLLDHGKALLKEAGTANSHPMLLRVERTLNAALVDSSARATLRRGELQTELAAPGFDVFGGARPAKVDNRHLRAIKTQAEPIMPNTTAPAQQKVERRQRQRRSLMEDREHVRPLQAAVDNAREELAAAAEQTKIAQAHLAALQKEVRQARQNIKERAVEARRLARTLKRAQQALNAVGHRPTHVSLPHP